MSRFESKNLAAIRAALDQHNGSCPVPANAILLNPVDRELIGWDELWGLPVLADERVPTKRVRIQCDGSAFGLEDELAEAIAREEPLIVPIVVPAGPADPARARRRRDLDLAGRHLEPAAERALEQVDLARGGPARDARLAVLTRSRRTASSPEIATCASETSWSRLRSRSSASRSSTAQRTSSSSSPGRVSAANGPRSGLPLRW